jgi:hypothetical protein
LFLIQQQNQLILTQQQLFQSQQQSQQYLKFPQIAKEVSDCEIVITSSLCPYCKYESKAENFINGVKIHIGHQHKCKKCKKLNADCICEQ